ncbi:4088_t:CDS:2, partial [Ambispora leptoticha]
VGDKITITPYEVENDSELSETEKAKSKAKEIKECDICRKNENEMAKDLTHDGIPFFIETIKGGKVDCYAGHKDQNGKILQQQNCSHCQPWKQHQNPKQELVTARTLFQKTNQTKITKEDLEKMINRNSNSASTKNPKGTSKVKTRGEVKGSTRKIYRQKGTGGARHGHRYAPQFKALQSLLGERMRNKKLMVVDKLELDNYKTKEAEKFLNLLPAKQAKTLLILAHQEENKEKIIRSFRNLPYISISDSKSVNAYQLPRDVLTQTISGTIAGVLSGLIVVLAQKHLEGRIKKLEEKERRKNEQEQYSGLSKTLITFKKMHIDNSKRHSSFTGWHEITPNGEKKEEYNVAFRIIRK